MKQLSFEDVMKLTEGSNEVYGFSPIGVFNSLKDIKDSLLLPPSRDKKESLEYFLKHGEGFIIIPNKDSLNTLKILKERCTKNTPVKEFKVGEIYNLKVGDPFKITRAKCLGEIKTSVESKFLVFKEEKNFYFFGPYWGDKILCLVEIIK